MKECLDENSVAEIVDFLMGYGEISDIELVDHILECGSCCNTVLQVYELIDQVNQFETP